jgi:hypothetical protein
MAPFGPGFFVGTLAGFVRDRCPDPAEGLPVVELHLVDGEALDLCHVIGLTPAWVALAVNETDQQPSVGTMRTELVPYDTIHRVTIRTVRHGTSRHGFDLSHEVVAAGAGRTPESALDVARTARPGRKQG